MWGIAGGGAPDVNPITLTSYLLTNMCVIRGLMFPFSRSLSISRMPIRDAVQGTGLDVVRRPRAALWRDVLPALRVRARAQEATHCSPSAMQEHQERMPQADLRRPHPPARTVLQDVRGRQYK